MQAINPIYTKKLQRMYKLDRQYSDLVDAHARAIAEELPKRECLNFDKQYKLVHGYTSTAVCYHV